MLFRLNKKEKETISTKKMDHPANFVSSQDESLSIKLKKTNWNNVDSCHYTSNGRFALHDIAIYFAREIGSAHVIICCFNISQVAARLLLRAYDKGYIESITLLLNTKKKHAFANNVKIIENIADIHYANVHAKVALIKNDTSFFSILTTGNMSNNNNIERGVIYRNKKDIYEFERDWINKVIRRSRGSN